MANVLNRTTKRYITSVNTPEYPTTEWIHNPDVSQVAGFHTKYWTITGDTVTLMSQVERDAVDANERTTRQLTQRDVEVLIVDALRKEGMRTRAIIEGYNKRCNFAINRIIQLQDALTAVKNSNGAADNIRVAIPATWLATQTRPLGQAIQSYKDDINSGVADV